MTDRAPKSAYEIAMERLRQKDAEQGIERKPVTEEQKAAIAEIRSTYEAKLAQEEVMHQSALARTFDPAARETMKVATVMNVKSPTGAAAKTSRR